SCWHSPSMIHSTPISCGVWQFSPYGHPQHTSFKARPQAPHSRGHSIFYRKIVILYTSAQIYQKKQGIFVTNFLNDTTIKTEYFVYSCSKTTISCGFYS